MAKRILLAGLAAGLVLYVWESVAHLALPLGEAGISVFPNEPAMLTAIRQNVAENGFYFFPNPNPPNSTEEQKKQAMQSMLTGPSGIMVVRPHGDPGMTPARLGLQALFDILSMIVAAVVLSQAAALKRFGPRVALVAMLSAIPTLRTELPQWNWYGFPALYTTAQFALHAVGFILGGLVLAKMIKAAPEWPR
ncbi:MAG TPA: hypothetical protein VMJ75_13555 [Candidatus Acidoferrales bacterium]|nr:hypothetical protein [Candidatus Acidoferrales bacterium]